MRDGRGGAVTRPQYAPVPRGYVRVWVLTVPWLSGGDMYLKRHIAELDAEHRHGATVTPLDVPAGAIPGLAATKGRRRTK